MTLGAFQFDSKEKSRAPAGQVLGLVFVGLIETRDVRIRQQPADHPVVGGVCSELLAQPAFEGDDHRFRLHGGQRQKLSSPEMSEVLDVQRSVIGAVQQLVDPLPALVRTSIVEEVNQLGQRRNPAIQIEAESTEELGIVGRRRWWYFFLRQAQADELVNPSRKSLGVLCWRGARGLGQAKSQKTCQDHGGRTESVTWKKFLKKDRCRFKACPPVWSVAAIALVGLPGQASARHSIGQGLEQLARIRATNQLQQLDRAQVAHLPGSRHGELVQQSLHALRRTSGGSPSRALRSAGSARSPSRSSSDSACRRNSTRPFSRSAKS